MLSLYRSHPSYSIALVFSFAVCICAPVLAQKGDPMATDIDQLRIAAEQGHAEAQYHLGILYKDGHGVAQDKTQAYAWYCKAANLGHVDAQRRLAHAYESYGDAEGISRYLAVAFIWYRKAAEQGDASSQYYLGVMYENGKVVARDHEQAALWYRKAAEQGDATAQNMLGLMYQDGRGVEKSHEQAAIWIGKAAEQENYQALFDLGLMYEMGLGVPKDPEKTLTLMRRAAAGHEGAVNWLTENGFERQ